MLFWILLLLIANGVVSFVYTAANTAEPSTLWALLTVNFVFFLGVTQTGIVYSAIMRIAKSGWGRYFSRLGEILTLSFIPVAVVMFFIIYISGVDHLFWWAHPEKAHGHHVSGWLAKGPFLWRNVISMALFYIMSYIYFRTGRIEEAHEHVPVELEKKLNTRAGFLMFFYIVTNTITAWDFGMMIIPHWESSIFPPYYWSGNVIAGAAFLFLISHYFIARAPGEKAEPGALDSVGKLFLGFALLWMYMYWSQFIVIWYSNLPELMVPIKQRMTGDYLGAFVVMLLAVFIIPFVALLFRRVKLSVLPLSIIALIICIGVWINRYLMIVPVFSDGSAPVFATYTGVALLLAGLSATLLSVKLFTKLFPNVTLKSGVKESSHH